MGRYRRSRRTLPKAICERTGMAFPYNEMVFEPGTNLFVHFKESDGVYSEVSHPQNFVGKSLTTGTEGMGLPNSRPDRVESSEGVYLLDSDSNKITTNGFSTEEPIYVYSRSLR